MNEIPQPVRSKWPGIGEGPAPECQPGGAVPRAPTEALPLSCGSMYINNAYFRAYSIHMPPPPPPPNGLGFRVSGLGFGFGGPYHWGGGGGYRHGETTPYIYIYVCIYIYVERERDIYIYMTCVWTFAAPGFQVAQNRSYSHTSGPNLGIIYILVALGLRCTPGF